MRRLPANSKWVEAQIEILSWPIHVPFETKENNTVEFLCELGSKDCYINQTREQRFLFEQACLLKRIAPATKGKAHLGRAEVPPRLLWRDPTVRQL